ncbi:hypothetical protein QBC47DRAFT_387405 [Echria macrotheca]|uniref:Stress-response A/B barrel domain-containing protein n=1 Tax=Echria macrotheca TaxID=438768 RepID=A0AAJ0F998_9PEZI|nr:hypothetical protein QBC47DRAFT_387405 [Echria macrotheca]
MWTKPRATAVLLLLILTGALFSAIGLFGPPGISKMTITHTVLFQFKAGLPVEDVKAACARFLQLADTCAHPTRGGTYIISLKGGKDHSPEGLQNGITHGFVVEFASVEDRDYYVAKDPAHMAFVKSIEDLVEKAIVVDFTDGEY